MSDLVWNSGYVTDVEYIDGYVLEMSPLMMNFNLTLAGVKAGHPEKITPPIGDFSYLELGYGRGTSLKIHGVTSEGSFVGTDFNPKHALIAQQYLNTLGANITAYEYSFDELYEKLHEEKASFDYIVFHGIFSWIHPTHQETILKIIRSFLKTGGVVYNSYNTFPGWASKAPARELLYLYSIYASGGINDKISGSIKFFEEFLKSGSLYAKSSPKSVALLEQLKGFLANKPAYIAHEYLNADWHCFYFHDMAARMQKVKCNFIGSAKSFEHFDDLSIAPESITFLDSVKDPIFKEQLKDYYTDRQFRTDLYARGAINLSQDEGMQKFLNTEYVLLKPIKYFNDRLNTPRGQAELEKILYGRLLDFLASQSYRPKLGSEIMNACEVNFQRFLNAICILIAQGMVSPTQKITQKIKKQSDAFNKGLFDRQLKNAFGAYVASPLTASGMIMNELELIIIKAYSENRKSIADIVEYVFKIYQAQGRRCMKDGKILTEDSENKDEIASYAKELLEDKLPILKVLGIC